MISFSELQNNFLKITFVGVNNLVNTWDSSWFIYCHHYPSFNYFTAPTELYKIALVSTNTTYHYVALHWSANQAKMHSFSVFPPECHFCYLLPVYGLLFSHHPKKPALPVLIWNLHLVDLYSGHEKPTNVPVEEHITYTFSRFSDLYSHDKLGHQKPMSLDYTNLLP